MHAARFVLPVATLLLCGCPSFHTASPRDAGTSDSAGDASRTALLDAAHPQRDATVRADASDAGADTSPARDAPPPRAPDAARDAPAADAPIDAGVDATVTVDTVCGFVWSSGSGTACDGRRVTSLGTIQGSDDPRISFAQSEAGVLGVCYANVFPDFLTRSLVGLTFRAPTAGNTAAPTAIPLFQSTYTDTTPACAIGGGPGSTLHVLVNDTTNSIVQYGDISDGGVSAYVTFGPNPITGYLSLGVVELDATHILAAIGNTTTGDITSYVVTSSGGTVTVAGPRTVESGIGFALVGAGGFSLRGGAQASMLIDMEPEDAGGARADLAIYGDAGWTVRTLEGTGLDANIGYSPSLAVRDGGGRAVYYERSPGTDDAGTSQIHVATIPGSSVTIATPLDASSDPDPDNPLVGAAAAIGPDGRLFIAYAASPSPGAVVLYLSRPETTVPGAPWITDTIDDKLSAADPSSINLVVEPTGRVDIVYMRLDAKSVLLATKDP